MSAFYLALADLVLLLHLAVVLFNVFGIIVIPLGAWRGWHFVRVFWWRALHLATLAVVALQAAAGRMCFLTIWHAALVQMAGSGRSLAPAISDFISRLIFWPLPLWAFIVIYVAVALFTLALWWIVPPAILGATREQSSKRGCRCFYGIIGTSRPPFPSWTYALYPDDPGRTGRVLRTKDGTPVALEDRCAHRHLPLSMGKLIGDELQCRYHGLRYDKSGRCIRIPGQDLVPQTARVRSYPVVERYRWLWIWMGDPALADPATIRISIGWTIRHGRQKLYLHVKANWQLIVDNLLDLTHLAFVHETTIGTAALAEHATVKLLRNGDNIVVTRWTIDHPAPPSFLHIHHFTTHVDRWQIIDFLPPAFVRLDVGATPTGTGARKAVVSAASACAI
jgi:nitrite reductase/ring-hydroxylating ferredoxin subunit